MIRADRVRLEGLIHQWEEKGVRDMGDATEYGDRICDWCNQQVPRRHRCTALLVLGDARLEQEK